MKPFKWQCPHCNHHTTITDSNHKEDEFGLSIENADGPKVLYSYYIVCPNEECNMYTLTSILFDTEYGLYKGRWQHYNHKEVKRWRLVPNSFAKVFPSYIPQSITQDYEEACSIIEESPKASATLARRCLQGMIRDFWNVNGATLFKEIESIKDKVDTLTWQSIDATRKIGNIGAHMEKDINLIIDVNPKEAHALIKLIEILIKDWYVNRHERQLMLQDIVDAGVKKTSEKKKPKEE
jgi:hypothetical protein